MRLNLPRKRSVSHQPLVINMKSEFHSVINEFQHLLNEYNFKCPKKLWYDDLICLSKHIIDIYYCYPKIRKQSQWQSQLQ